MGRQGRSLATSFQQAAAGWLKGYSPVCRSNLGYTKGTTKVCYRVGVLTDANFQAIGSQWSGFLG